MPPPPGESTHRNRVNGTNGHRTGEHPAARGPGGANGANGTNGAGGYGTGERPAVRPGGAYRTGEVPAAGGARHRVSGEWQPAGDGPVRKAPADYTYRAPRTDRRQIVAVGLALVLVFGVSLAIVTFTRGEQGTPSRSDAPVTSVPPDESTVPSSVPVPGSPGPQAPEPHAPGPSAPTTPPAGESPAADGGTGATAPEIGRFGAVEQGLGPPCEATQRRITLAWESTGGTSARIEGPGAPTGDLPANGQATACRATGPPQTYTLTVTGPGGSTFRTTSV